MFTDTQPQDAGRNDTITTVDLDPKAAPVQVELEDSTGLVKSFNGTVQLTIATGSSTATVSGGTATAKKGVATFPTLTIDTSDHYTLQATSTDVAPTSSDSFTIFDQVCTTSCTTGDTTHEQVTAKSGGGSGAVGLAVNIDTVTCDVPAGATYNQAPYTWTIDSTTTTNKTVILTVSKADDQAQPENGASFYQVCFQGDSGAPFWLPDCPSKNAMPPCVLSKTKNKAGQVLIKVLLGAGDPKGR